MIARELEDILRKNFDCSHLEVINESHLHAGHAGSPGTGESHFKVIIASDAFQNQSKVERHKSVNKAIAPLFSNGLHALSLSVFTQKEYADKIFSCNA